MQYRPLPRLPPAHTRVVIRTLASQPLQDYSTLVSLIGHLLAF